MFPAKLSILNPFAASRVNEVRKQIILLKADLDLSGLPDLKNDPKARMDRYFASMPIMMKNFFEFLEKEISENKPIITWKEGDNFKEKFLEFYYPQISELSLKYFRKLCEQVSESVKQISEGEKKELTEDQRAYVSFMIDDDKNNGGVNILSPVDALFVLSHIAGLVVELCKPDLERFEQVMRSKSVLMLVNSLMINESSGMSSVMGLLAASNSVKDHKENGYNFNTDFFAISSDNNLVLRNDILSAMRRVYEKNRDKVAGIDRRNCPASYAPEETKIFFAFITQELENQYRSFL